MKIRQILNEASLDGKEYSSLSFRDKFKKLIKAEKIRFDNTYLPGPQTLRPVVNGLQEEQFRTAIAEAAMAVLEKEREDLAGLFDTSVAKARDEFTGAFSSANSLAIREKLMAKSLEAEKFAEYKKHLEQAAELYEFLSLYSFAVLIAKVGIVTEICNRLEHAENSLPSGRFQFANAWDAVEKSEEFIEVARKFIKRELKV